MYNVKIERYFHSREGAYYYRVVLISTKETLQTYFSTVDDARAWCTSRGYTVVYVE